MKRLFSILMLCILCAFNSGCMFTEVLLIHAKIGATTFIAHQIKDSITQTNKPSHLYSSNKSTSYSTRQNYDSTNYFSEGINDYKNSNYQESISKLEYGIKHKNLNNEELAKAYIYLGASHYLLGNKHKAKRVFKKAHKLNTHIDKKIFMPEVVEIFENSK